MTGGKKKRGFCVFPEVFGRVKRVMVIGAAWRSMGKRELTLSFSEKRREWVHSDEVFVFFEWGEGYLCVTSDLSKGEGIEKMSLQASVPHGF